MGKTIKPLERIEQADTLWTWFERFGLVKTAFITLGGGGVITFVVAWIQHLPRWIILCLVFVVSALLVLSFFVGAVWMISSIQKKIMSVVSENPLSERVTALERSLGPRHISDAQRQMLLGVLSQERGEIKISAVNPDDDAAQYAEEFASLLRDAEWTVWGVDRPYDSRPDTFNTKIGVTLLATTTEGITPYPPAQRLADALSAASIAIHYFVSYELHKGSCELIIGHRGTAAY